MTIQLDANDHSLLDEYSALVTNKFSRKFLENEDRFTKGKQLIERFLSSVEEVRRRGRGFFRAVDEAHNELCIAAALLENKGDIHDKYCQGENGDFPLNHQVCSRLFCPDLSAYLRG